MDSTLNLKQDLSMLLETALKEHLVPGESVEISLPGSFGEALAVTNKRVLVIRECGNANMKCDVYVYPFEAITGADVNSSGMGGYIEIKLSQPPSNQDEARVYFPSYEQVKFQAAAVFVNEAVASKAKPSISISALSSSEAEGLLRKCQDCGAALSAESAFCGQCGRQVASICKVCGSASPAGSKFCRGCGVEMWEYRPECSKCGARVQRWYTYCPQCGSILQQLCAVCGGWVIDNWKYCPHCGRLLGSESIDMRSSFVGRLREHEAAKPIKGKAQAVSAVSTKFPDAAEEHNRRGSQLFDDGDIGGAIREFQAAIDLDPQNASYHCNLAIAYDANEQDSEALVEYEKALRLDPNDLTALLSVGYLYNENDQPERAIQYWNRILEIAPDSAEAQEAMENLRHLQEL